ncbi:acyltransferase [Microbacterium sp. Sa4CUA7]|uniref:Acyltransferase n=1 Tax=Microbacterium pullorum TaxID=2762236 RepID=A0ABR8S161_9MICO|nr:acyltransferase [Microbacterium pullorum]
MLGVLLFHLWPHRLTGGYVGVDVFFVVSGYLITDHLLREYRTHGRISLPAFWARRARRLLPASLLVLAVTAAAVYLWVPLTRWSQFGWEIVASAFYVQNWAMAAQSVDYMAMSNAASPVQHFWTLGVEEQFYVVWPVLLVCGAALAMRLRRGGLQGMTSAIVVVTVASFAYSVLFTAASPDVAYYSTFTRAWEFGAGALLALGLRRRPVWFRPRTAAAVSWLGFAAIGATMMLFDASTPFPSSTAALPVLATALVIAAGTPSAVGAPTRLLALRPVQFVGDISYGVYLWHWPLIVLLPYLTGHRISVPEAIAILCASLLLGWASKRFVEDPVRSLPWLARGAPRRSLLSTLAAMGAVTAASLPLALSTVPPPPTPPAQPVACWGAEAMADTEGCGPADEVAMAAPVVSFAADLPTEEVRACEITVEVTSYRRCDLVAAEGTTRLALVGDSHATRWVEAFERAARSEGWGLTTYLVSGCPLVSAAPIGGAWGFDPVGGQLCPQPTAAVVAELLADPTITDVVFTNRTRLYISEDPADHPLSAATVEETIRALQQAGKNVVVLADPPEVRGVPELGAPGAIDCLASPGARDCDLPREAAGFADPMRAAADLAGAPVVDLTDMFCTDERCLWRIGGLVVYTDDNHLTRSFAASLARPLTERLIGSGVGDG